MFLLFVCGGVFVLVEFVVFFDRLLCVWYLCCFIFDVIGWGVYW